MGSVEASTLPRTRSVQGLADLRLRAVQPSQHRSTSHAEIEQPAHDFKVRAESRVLLPMRPTFFLEKHFY